MAAHLILRCMHWGQETVFQPSKTMEDSIEHFFGMMKTLKKQSGTITLANSIAATHLLHCRQSRKPPQACTLLCQDGSWIKLFAGCLGTQPLQI